MDPIDLREWEGFQKNDSSLIDQVVIDSRLINSKNALFVALQGEKDGHAFVRDAYQKGAKYALVKKDFDPTFPESFLIRVDDPLRALQQVATLYRKKKKAIVVGITGSKGKTMVKDFLKGLLESKKRVICSPESFNSQIGVALSLLQIKDSHEIALIEAGISDPGEMDYLISMIQPDHAILTVVEESHYSKDVIAHEKSKLLNSVPQDGWLLFPRDASLPQFTQKQFHWNSDLLPKAVAIPSKDPFTLDYTLHFQNGNTSIMQFKRPFKYALDLVNIGIKAAHLLGLEENEIVEALKRYNPDLRQTEIWTNQEGVTYINEPYSQDTMSVVSALKRLKLYAKGRKIFIFGGIKDKPVLTEGELQKIVHAIKETDVDSLVLVGPQTQLAEKISAPLTKSVKESISLITNDLRFNDTILIQSDLKTHLDDLSIPHNQLTINLSTVAENIQCVRRLNPHVKKVIAMIKANGYGTDSIMLAKFLKKNGINLVGVAHPDEAIQLRKNGVQQSIFVIHAALFEVQKIVDGQFEVGVSSLDFIQNLEKEAHAKSKQVKVHLHIDTGMNRLGCKPSEALLLAKEIAASPSLIFEGVMTHFACADMKEEDDFTKNQVERFRQSLTELENAGLKPFWVHAGNSSGSIRGFFKEGNLIRLGLALFGLQNTPDIPMQLAVNLTSRIVGINICKKGENISYGRTYTVKEEEERIAVIPLGYFDGLHRQYSGKGTVLIRGQEAPMVGRICMDFMMCNVTHIKEADLGDPVLIFGEDAKGNTVLPEAFAEKGSTNTHELITCLGPRIQRVFIEND